MEYKFLRNGDLMLREVPFNDIKFRRFDGHKDRYHQDGDRGFNLQLDEALAEELIVRNWRVKAGKLREDGTPYPPMLYVHVRLNGKTKINRFSESGCVELTKDPDLVSEVDTDQIESASFVLHPWLHEDGKYSIFLSQMDYKLEPNPLAGIYD